MEDIQQSLKHSIALGRSFGFLLNILEIRPFSCEEYLSKAGSSLIYELIILLIVWLWYSDSKGVRPVTIL